VGKGVDLRGFIEFAGYATLHSKKGVNQFSFVKEINSGEEGPSSLKQESYGEAEMIKIDELAEEVGGANIEEFIQENCEFGLMFYFGGSGDTAADIRQANKLLQINGNAVFKVKMGLNLSLGL